MHVERRKLWGGTKGDEDRRIQGTQQEFILRFHYETVHEIGERDLGPEVKVQYSEI